MGSQPVNEERRMVMRYRYLAVCGLLFLLLLTGCGGVESPTPDGSPSSVETGAPAQTTREPVEIVLQGVDAPGMALDVAGFEDSLWGDSIEEILEGEDLSGWTLVNEHTTFGGVNCKAYYTFRDGGLAGGYYSIKFGEYGPEGFRAVLDYLTELYGEPGFLFDGEGEAVSDPNEGFADGVGAGVLVRLLLRAAEGRYHRDPLGSGGWRGQCRFC